MVAKVIARGADRSRRWTSLGAALEDTRVDGVATNLGLLRAALALPELRSVAHSTATLDGVTDPEPRIEVLAPGALTTVQDWPGRLGYWQVGVPPSGPMDEVSLREANLAVGNPEGAPALECTATGPALKFSHDTVVCLGGAVAVASLDGRGGLDGGPCPGGSRSPCRPGRPSRSARSAAPGCAATWPCAAASTCPPTWAARRRSRWAGSAGTAAAPSRPATSSGRAPTSARPPHPRRYPSAGRPAIVRGLGDRGHRGTARGTGVLHPGRHRRAVRQQLHGAPQLGAHRRPAHRAASVVGPRGRRRGRAAPVQHPRCPLRGRRARLHRGHADHPRPGRAEPGRVRLPGGRRERRAVEDGAAPAGRHRALRAGARGGRGVPAGPARHASAGAHRR